MEMELHGEADEKMEDVRELQEVVAMASAARA
eukprot:SAG11_NODE_29893_length_306_cov_0.739130_1_plen_31_part_10